MISGEHSVDLHVDVDVLWDYMWDFSNWARHVIGYQKFEVVNESRSLWTLRGDVGILAREVDFQVDLIKAEPKSSAEFEITGLTENISGMGAFQIRSLGDEAAGEDAAPVGTSPEGTKRWQRGLYRAMSRGIRGTDRTSEQGGSHPQTDGGDTTVESEVEEPAGPPKSRLSFQLQVTPGGPMAPMLEVLMAPLMKPAADDICERIRIDLGGTDGN